MCLPRWITSSSLVVAPVAVSVVVEVARAVCVRLSVQRVAEVRLKQRSRLRLVLRTRLLSVLVVRATQVILVKPGATATIRQSAVQESLQSLLRVAAEVQAKVIQAVAVLIRRKTVSRVVAVRVQREARLKRVALGQPIKVERAETVATTAVAVVAARMSLDKMRLQHSVTAATVAMVSLLRFPR